MSADYDFETAWRETVHIMAMFRKLNLVALGLLLPVATASAQIVGPAAQIGATTTVELPTRAGQVLISGRVVDANATPLPKARLRLRNLNTNQIEQTTVANAAGEFTFVVRPDVPYVVEIADADKRTIAVGDVIVGQAGDVASTVVTVPGRLPAGTGMFSDTAASVILAATGMGLTVLPFVSPER